MLYDIIYNFFADNIFNSQALDSYSSEIMGVSTTLNQYLSHSATILLLCLGVFWLILVIRWVFRVFSGLIKL